MQEHQGQIRYFLLTHVPSIGFFPLGFLGVLLILLPLLYGITVFATKSIEATVHTEIQRTLEAHGFGWVIVETDGQHVLLSGRGSKEQGDKAIQLARNVQADTWFNPLTAAIAIKGDFSLFLEEDAPQMASTLVTTDSSVTSTAQNQKSMMAENKIPAVNSTSIKNIPSIAEPTVTEPTLKEVIAPSSDTPIWGNVQAVLKAGVLIVEGQVSAENVKTGLLNITEEHINTGTLERVVDKLHVSAQNLLPESSLLAHRALMTIIQCDEGQARVHSGTFSLHCEASRRNAAKVNRLARAPFSGGMGQLGDVLVSVTAACHRDFSELLQEHTIHFATDSAELAPSSAILLDKVASIANECPGVIEVEGHTDDTGAFERNQLLSQSRANAVVLALVDRGVAESRLMAQGYGPTKPRVAGSTPEARARNRRIEFRVLAIGEN